jgi:amino acid adenylation domain-containing protein
VSLADLGARDARPAILEPGRGEVSYAALDELANRVAGRLLALGVTSDSRVGLYLNRSADAVAAMLGVLRAGCAYVPVDPRAPAERNAEILTECEVFTSLVEEPYVERFRSACRRLGRGGGLEPIGPTGLGRAIAHWAPGRAEPAPAPAQESEIACVLYTSGSTGRHKGWLMSRAAIQAHAAWSRALIRPVAGDVFANHAQLNFGMSLFDVFTSLGAGVPLLLVPDPVRPFADRIVDLISRERVTIWFSGPGILSLIARVEGLEKRDLGALRLVAFAGEVFPAPALRALRRRLPHPRFFNFYGSTETNVAAFHELPPDVDFDEPPPIGRPCAHYEARVIGLDGEPASPGSVGELQLRGAGLTTGYLDQPELTAERLLAAPGGGLPWYRTGDLVVELAGGELRHAGRLGRMLKLRGYRVEPGEIETRLHEHPRVAAAAVVPVEGPHGLQLVAHLCSERLPVVELKRFCAVKLPPYMIPERFVFHAALPRNLRGKIDLEALRTAADPGAAS